MLRARCPRCKGWWSKYDTGKIETRRPCPFIGGNHYYRLYCIAETSITESICFRFSGISIFQLFTKLSIATDIHPQNKMVHTSLLIKQFLFSKAKVWTTSTSGFLQGHFFWGRGGESIAIQISFVILIFLFFWDQMSGMEVSETGGNCLRGAPPLC